MNRFKLVEFSFKNIVDSVLGKKKDSSPTITANTATPDEHMEMMNTMSQYMDNEKPKVGIFWYDVNNKSLFGVEKGDAEKYIKDRGVGTLPKLHRTYWQKQHHRSVAKGFTDSIFYNEKNYTLIPRGRVFVRTDGTCYVAVGKWFNGVINGEKMFDEQHIRELIADEFDLPDDFPVVYDEHWDLGHGWSGDVL